jgi:hypothetical protein
MESIATFTLSLADSATSATKIMAMAVIPQESSRFMWRPIQRASTRGTARRIPARHYRSIAIDPSTLEDGFPTHGITL